MNISARLAGTTCVFLLKRVEIVKPICSAFHLDVSRCAIHFHAFRSRNPEYVVTPNQHLPESTSMFAIDVFLCVVKLDVHVRIYADEGTLVFSLSPFESYYHFFVDPVNLVSA